MSEKENNGQMSFALPGGHFDDPFYVLGEIAYLMINSPLHQSYRLADLESYFLTPIKLNQFRIYRRGTRPVGLATWAYLKPDAASGYVDDTRELRPDDWNAGTEPWLVDFMAPFGGVREMVRDLRENVHPNARVRSLRRDYTGTIRKHVDWYGVNAKRDAA